jgi:hypothetical protein
MNYYTLFYLIIILFIIFKNEMFSTIIDFNTKNNTKIYLNNIINNTKNKINNTKDKINNTKDKINNMNNIKKIIILFITCYLIYNMEFIYKSFIFLFSIIIYFNYTKINYILNQLVNIYYDNFLINKFMLV